MSAVQLAPIFPASKYPLGVGGVGGGGGGVGTIVTMILLLLVTISAVVIPVKVPVLYPAFDTVIVYGVLAGG